LKLGKATAKTDSKTGKVDLEVKVQFNVIASGKLSELGTADIRLPSLVLPAASEAPKQHALVETPSDPVLVHADSSWIPLVNADTLLKQCTTDSHCSSIEPTTVVATVLETGTGSEAFGQLSADATNSTKTLEGIISQALQGKSGSSNSSSPPKK
jgi:hypothetical protein